MPQRTCARSQDVDRDIVIKLKDSLRIQWEKYFEEDKKIHLLAAAWLDPYWHTRWITPAVHQNPQELVKEVEAYIFELALKCYRAHLRREPEEDDFAFDEAAGEGVIPMEVEVAEVWMDAFQPLPEVQAAEEDPIEQTIEKEMKVFKNKCKDYADKGKKRSDTLDCWKKFEPRAPNLARAARVLLAVPVTSAACERDFSASKALYTPQRRSMSQETLENFTMIRRRSKVPSNEQKRKRAQTKPGGNL